MTFFLENRLVNLKNTDLLKLMPSSTKSNLETSDGKVENPINPSQLKSEQEKGPMISKLTEIVETGSSAQAKLAEALRSSGEANITEKSIEQAGITQAEAESALSQLSNNDNNHENLDHFSVSPEVSNILKNTRKSIFASIGEFFSDTWEKLKNLFKR
jgi:hypothetical protein